MSDKNIKLEYQFVGTDNGLSETAINISKNLETLEQKAKSASKALEKLNKNTKTQNTTKSHNMTPKSSTNATKSENQELKKNLETLKRIESSNKRILSLKRSQQTLRVAKTGTQQELKDTEKAQKITRSYTNELDKKIRKVKDANDAFKKYSQTVNITSKKLAELTKKNSINGKDLFSFESKLNQLSSINKKTRDFKALRQELEQLRNTTKKRITLFEKNGMTKEADVLKTKLRELDNAIHKASNSANEAGSKYVVFGNRLQQVSRQVNGLSQKLITAGANVKAFASKISSVGRTLISTGQSLRTVASYMRTLSYGITAGFAGAIKEGVDVEKSLAGVASTINRMEIDLDTGKIFRMDDSTFQGYMDDIEKEMKRLSAISPFDNKAVADSFRYTALAGWTPQEMLDSMETFTKLSTVIGSEDIATDVDKITDSLASLGLAFDKIDLEDGSFEYVKKNSADLASEVERLTDVMAKAQSVSNMDISQLAESYKKVGGTMSTLNVPLETTTALLAVLANRGLKGNVASTGLSTTMLRLTARTGESAKALDELTKKTGINVKAFDEATGEYVGVEKQLENIGNAMDKLNEKDRIQLTGMIAGKQHIKTFTKLLEGFRGEYKEVKALISNSDGALDEMFDITNQSAWAELKMAVSNVKNALYDAFQSMRPLFTEVLNSITKVAQAFTNLSDADKKSALMFAGLVAVAPIIISGFALISIAIGSVISIIASCISILGTFISLLGSVGKIGGKAFSSIGSIASTIGATFLGSKLGSKLIGSKAGSSMLGLFGKKAGKEAGEMATKKVVGEAVETGVKKGVGKLAGTGLASFLPGIGQFIGLISAVSMAFDAVKLANIFKDEDKTVADDFNPSFASKLFGGGIKKIGALFGGAITKGLDGILGTGASSNLAGTLKNILQGIKKLFNGGSENKLTQEEKQEIIQNGAKEYVDADKRINKNEERKRDLESNISINNNKIRDINEKIFSLRENLKELEINPKLNAEEIKKAEKELDKLYEERDTYSNLIIEAEDEIDRINTEIGKDRETKLTIKEEIESAGGGEKDIEFENKRQILAEVGIELAYSNLESDISMTQEMLRKLPGVRHALKAKLELENITDEEYNEIVLALEELNNFEAMATAYIDCVRGQDEIYKLQSDINELDGSTAEAQIVINTLTHNGKKDITDLTPEQQQAVQNARNKININNGNKEYKQGRINNIKEEKITPYEEYKNDFVELGNKHKNKGDNDYITYFSNKTQDVVDKWFGKLPENTEAGNMLGKTTARKMVYEHQKEVSSGTVNTNDKMIDFTKDPKEYVIETKVEPPDVSEIEEWATNTTKTEIEFPASIDFSEAGEGVDEVNSKTEQANSNVETLSNGVEITSRNVDNLNTSLEGTNEQTDNLNSSVDETAEKTGGLFEKIKGLFKGDDETGFGDKISKDVDGASEKIDTLIEKVDGISSAMSNINFSTLTEAVSGLQETLESAREKLLSISNVANNLGKESMTGMGQALIESFNGAREAVLSVANVASNYGKSCMTSMGQALSDALITARTDVLNVANVANNYGKNCMTSMGNALTGALSGARTAVLNVANVANNYGKSSMAGMGNALVSTVSNAKSIVASIASQISSIGSQIETLKQKASSIKLPTFSSSNSGEQGGIRAIQSVMPVQVLATPLSVSQSAGFRSIGGNTTNNSIANTTSNFNFNVKGALGGDRQSIKQTARQLTTYCKRRGL